MNSHEKQKLIELVRCLPEKKKQQFYFMVLGAAFAAKEGVK